MKTLSLLPVALSFCAAALADDGKFTIYMGGKPVASKTVRFGFRHVESRNANVYLNGHPIFLRGLAINPPGRTVPEPLGSSRQFAYDYVKYMKGQNLNLIRVNEPNQDWFDVCDEADGLQRLPLDRSFHCRRIDIDANGFHIVGKESA